MPFSALDPTMKNRDRSSSTSTDSILCKKRTKRMSVTKREPRRVLSESVTAECATEKGQMSTSSTATNRSAKPEKTRQTNVPQTRQLIEFHAHVHADQLGCVQRQDLWIPFLQRLAQEGLVVESVEIPVADGVYTLHCRRLAAPLALVGVRGGMNEW